MSDAANSPQPQPDDLTERRGFWARYSPRGEFPWSSAMSFMLLVFLSVLVIVAATPFLQGDPTPPAVDVLYVGDDENAPAGEGQDLAADAALQGTSMEDPLDATLKELDVEKLTVIPEPEIPTPEVKPRDQTKDVADETTAAETALDQLARARQQLAANLNKGSGEGTGTGGGGTGTTGRGARVARWVLHFNTRSPQHYLKQLDGLGAVIAFPLVDNKWRYYFDVSSPRRRHEDHDLSGENRLYWVDEKSESIAGVARELGIPTPPFMIVFLPIPLEDRMLKMELDYRGRREEQILRTDFEVIENGRYDVKVMRQLPR